MQVRPADFQTLQLPSKPSHALHYRCETAFLASRLLCRVRGRNPFSTGTNDKSQKCVPDKPGRNPILWARWTCMLPSGTALCLRPENLLHSAVSSKLIAARKISRSWGARSPTILPKQNNPNLRRLLDQECSSSCSTTNSSKRSLIDTCRNTQRSPPSSDWLHVVPLVPLGTLDVSNLDSIFRAYSETASEQVDSK